MNLFQISLLGIFIFLLIVSVLVFAGVLPGFRPPSGGAGGTVTWWGTVPEDNIKSILETFKKAHEKDFTLVYVAKNEKNIESELVDALAGGRGPDLVSLPHESLVRQSDKLLPIPEASYPADTFRKTFVLGTHTRDWSLYLAPEGAMGLPLYLDPLVMYYNQDLLSNARLTVVPRTWNEVQSAVKSLTKADQTGNVMQSAIALGQFANILHAKDILSLLIMQAGNPIVVRDNRLGYKVVLKDLLGYTVPPTGEAVAFWNRFADSANALYSWNSALPEARDAFVSGELALYLGYASELARLHAQNPQLNFDVAEVPQRASPPAGGRDIGFARITAVSITKTAKNPATALTVAELLSGHDFAQALAGALGLPPARNDLLQTRPRPPAGGSGQAIFYAAAVAARAWPDPAPERSAVIWKQLAESTRTGQAELTTAVAVAHNQLDSLFNRQ